MIQRIQTVYMLLCVVAVVLCMCNPVGLFDYQGTSSTLYNLWISRSVNGVVVHEVMPWVAMFAILTFVASLITIDIFLFKKRALQMRILNFCLILLVLYYVVGGVFVYMAMHGDVPCDGFRPTIWTAMPFVAVVLGYLAFRGILKDQLLINSLDRLR